MPDFPNDGSHFDGTRCKDFVKVVDELDTVLGRCVLVLWAEVV